MIWIKFFNINNLTRKLSLNRNHSLTRAYSAIQAYAACGSLTRSNESIDFYKNCQTILCINVHVESCYLIFDSRPTF